MEYFVPAWHSQYEDWAVSIPTIENYDATRTMQVLEDNNYQIGLVITDYQPQIASKLNRLSFAPDELFSVFDYLQGIDTFESKIVELTDFNWPKKATFDFGPFRTLIAVDDKLYATVFYDSDGLILKIEYQGKTEAENYTLLMDSRGFVSSKITQEQTIFYNPFGQWRFKVEKNSGKVTINPKFNFCEKLTYANVSELVNEVYQNYVVANFDIQQDHLIVTLDDHALIANNQFTNIDPIFLINKNIEFQAQLQNIKPGKLVVSEQELADQIINLYGDKFEITVIPTHTAEFNLGHSSREAMQEITLFAENIEVAEAKKLIYKLCVYVAESPKDRRLKIFTYDFLQADHIDHVLSEIKQENSEKFIIEEDKLKVENNGIEDTEDENRIPSIKVEHQRLTNISQLLNLLDTTRVLVNYGKADELMQMAAISIGIPQLQNFLSPTVKNGKNGYIYQGYDELITYIDKYLNDLNTWNNALVYNVQLMNRYSEENIMQKWQALLENSQEE